MELAIVFARQGATFNKIEIVLEDGYLQIKIGAIAIWKCRYNKCWIKSCWEETFPTPELLCISNGKQCSMSFQPFRGSPCYDFYFFNIWGAGTHTEYVAPHLCLQCYARASINFEHANKYLPEGMRIKSRDELYLNSGGCIKYKPKETTRFYPYLCDRHTSQYGCRGWHRRDYGVHRHVDVPCRKLRSASHLKGYAEDSALYHDDFDHDYLKSLKCKWEHTCASLCISKCKRHSIIQDSPFAVHGSFDL